MRSLALLALLLITGCPEPEPDDLLHGAPGLSIEQIAIYQGLKRPLVVDGQTVESDIPLIAGRDALLRVYVATDDAYDGEPVTGRLLIDGQDVCAEATFDGYIEEPELDSTLNFEVPGELIDDSIEWSVELLQEVDPEAANAAARYPLTGTATTRIDGAANTFRLLIAPFQYDFDGSGRLPDLSDAAIERIREHFLKLYPVSEVEVTVREPHPWSSEIKPDGDGWAAVGFALLTMRDQDGTPDDVYYYGYFQPTDSFGEYCHFGCQLGVTLLNDEPPDVGTVELRLALGVGYGDEAAWTAVHELGHAHGRAHSPCGPPGNMPTGIDPDYPHEGAAIGPWGYDLVEHELVDPDEVTDFMGYCDQQWISDYTWRAIYERGQRINLPALQDLPDQVWDVVDVSPDGAKLLGSTRRHAPPGQPLEGAAFAQGAPSPVQARWLPWDHLDGGWLFVPRGEVPWERIEIVAGGELVRLER